MKFDSFLCFFSFLFCCGFCFLIIVIIVIKTTKNIKKAITVGRKRVRGGGGGHLLGNISHQLALSPGLFVIMKVYLALNFRMANLFINFFSFSF